MNDSAENLMEKHPGPSLRWLAMVHTLLFVCSLFAFAVLSGGGHIPSPFGAESTFYLTQHTVALRWSAFFLFGCAVPLGLFGAVAASRLLFLGIRAAGVHIAFFGGVGASFGLAASGLTLWIVADPAVGGSARALQLASFAAGGPAFAVAFGLLAAGVSLSAGLSHQIPRWAMWLGLFVAAVGELSSLSLVFLPAALLLPLARFPGLVWLIALGWLLPTSRRVTR